MGRLSEGSVTYRVLRALERRLYRAADAIVVLAEGSEAVIREDVGVAKQIEFIPNGADVDRFASVEPDQTRTPLVFLYAGAHGPANGLELLLDAAEEMQARRVDVIIRLLGDGVSKARLVTDASRRGLANVEFVDPVPKDAIPAQMAEASVGLHVLADVPMFRYGVSPNKLFEYMAAGLPVITNTPGEVSHLVEASDGGFVVGPRGLADGIERMAELAPEARAQLGQHGRDWVTRERDRRRLADALESLLRSVGR
jgi:glycosyltransferase involved in cell wall biosynthesis